jgi:hypothetical protein
MIRLDHTPKRAFAYVVYFENEDGTIIKSITPYRGLIDNLELAPPKDTEIKDCSTCRYECNDEFGMCEHNPVCTDKTYQFWKTKFWWVSK